MATALTFKSEIKINDRKITAIDVPKNNTGTIITASLDKKINFYNTDLKVTKNIETDHIITALKADGNGQNVLYGTFYGELFLLNGNDKVEFEKREKCIHSIDICEKTYQIIVGDASGIVTLYNTAGQVIKTWNLEQPVYSIKFIPDSPYFACGLFDGTVRFMDIETDNLVCAFFEGEAVELERFDGSKTFPASTIDISPDGSVVAYGNRHGQIFINSAESKKLYYQCDLKAPIADIAIASIKALLAIGAGNTLFIFDVVKSEIIIKENVEKEISTVCWNNDDVVVGFLDGEVKSYNLN